MLGSAGAAGRAAAVVAAQHHRGPDADDLRTFAGGRVALGANRLRIVDLDPAADGVLSTDDGRLHLAFNGEVYNHVELRAELADRHRFRTGTDTEVVLAAWAAWGPACLDRFLGMFALLVWDDEAHVLHAARDRFGVKPLHHARVGDALVVASELAALLAAGVPAEPDPAGWATYLANGHQPPGPRTFWTGVEALGAGERAEWALDAPAAARTVRWYDLAARVDDQLDDRPDATVADEVDTLLDDAVGLRFRADVPVGVAVSGGLDSSSLLGLVDRLPGAAAHALAFTFTTGDPAYDEDGEVAALLAGGTHRLHRCRLDADEVPVLAADVHARLRQPYGGIPTLAYARLFERAGAEGVRVVLDGQGLDEAWAGYDYHRHAGQGAPPLVQGTTGGATRPDCLTPALRALAEAPAPPDGFTDPLRSLQLRDLLQTKLPRALRYNDGVSMRSSVELREPFLDHRLVELALRQPPHRTVGQGEGKALVRRLAPRWGRTPPPAKQAVQTPQREWLRGPLAAWTEGRVAAALDRWGGTWLDADRTRRAWSAFRAGEGDNAHFVWQWVGLGLEAEAGADGEGR